VNAEIGRFHHLYARPSGAQGWVALIAASKAPYPDPFQYLSSSEVKDGKFVPRRSLNRQLFDPYVGYVREDLLGSLDEVPPPPQIPMRGLMPVPAYWAPIGIDENRRFVSDLSQPPYDALVRIAHQLGSCSGVIVLEPTLVVTSGHCFKTDNDEALVIVERAPNQIDKIPARIVQREEGQHSFKDWAVLRLKRSPNFPVTPLQFADGIDWSNTTRFWGVVTGYPGDLFQTVSKKHVGFEAPSISQCLIDVAQHKAIEDAMQIEHSCEQWFGISGGPLLVWNPNADRFEVLALNTLLSAGFSGTDSELNDLFNESIFRSQAKSVIRQFNLQNESSLFDLNRQDFAGIPGLASVHSAYQRWTTSLYSSKGTLSTKMIEVARREAGLIPEASPYLNDPKRLGFWFSKEKEWNIWLPTTTARADCVQWCDEIIIKPQGWTLQLGQKVNWDELAKRDDTLANENVGWMIVGGDLFYIDKESWEVTGVVRRFMSLKEYGAGFNRQFELWQQYKHLLNEYSDDFIWNEESYSEVKPTSALRSDNFGDDTPTEIPGGKIIKANALARLLDSTHPPLVISSISTTLGLPGSVDLAYSSQGGTYNDDLQQQLGQDLGKLSEGDKSRELVFYCHHAKCWLSYNSALRAINLGYSNVYWFRGGINTWADRGLPFDWMKKVNN
jgi:PQQ-dependent catabolism-associated CXXCW motif protein